MSAAELVRPGKQAFPVRRSRLMRPVLVCGLLAALAATAFVISLALGTGNRIPIGEVVLAVVGLGDPDQRWVIMTLRMPRALTALLVGAALALSGAILQSVSRNVLASPDIIGFSAGSATGGLVLILVAGAGPFAISVGAVAGGLLTAALVLGLSRAGARLVLVGVGAGAFLTAANSLMLTRAEAGEALSAAVWLSGTLNVRTWGYVLPVLVVLLLAVPALIPLARPMRMLEMGDDTATALGVPTARVRPALVGVAVVLVAVAVSVAGPIGFVALAAPQIGRRLVGAASVALIPAALTGALLVAVSDLVAMRIFAPAQLPVGVVTAALGGAYLVWLLSVQWRAGRG